MREANWGLVILVQSQDIFLGEYKQVEDYFLKYYKSSGITHNCISIKHIDTNYELYENHDPNRNLGYLVNWKEKNKDKSIENTNLFIKEVYVDSARMLKRIQPAPQGRAHRIRKRSNHVTIVLNTKDNK